MIRQDIIRLASIVAFLDTLFMDPQYFYVSVLAIAMIIAGFEYFQYKTKDRTTLSNDQL